MYRILACGIACALIIPFSAQASDPQAELRAILERGVQVLTITATSSATTTPTSTPTTSTPRQSRAETRRSPSIFDDLLNRALSRVSSFVESQLSRALSPERRQVSTGASDTGAIAPSGAITGIPFGGPILTLIPCSNAAIYVVLGPPTPGPYVWMPGTISYAYGPPSFVGQYLLGLAVPGAGVCVVGNNLLLGSRILVHGSSGPTVPSPAPRTQAPRAASATQGGCAGPITTPAQKLAAETKIRADLAACGVPITSSRTGGKACAYGEDGVKAGCTDVGGLQCQTVDYLCALRAQCGRFAITGGSELGHNKHTPGNAFDADMSLWRCVTDNPKVFERISNCRYRDRRTGTTFLNEALCKTERGTGDHIHVCVGGKGC